MPRASATRCEPEKSCATARPRRFDETLTDTLFVVVLVFDTRVLSGFGAVLVVVGVDCVVATVVSGAVVVAATVVVTAAAVVVVDCDVVRWVVVCAVVVGTVVVVVVVVDVVDVVLVVVEPSVTSSDPFMVEACASHWKWYVPGCSVTDQLSDPVPLMLVLSLTPGPLRWKLCMLELSETLIV